MEKMIVNLNSCSFVLRANSVALSDLRPDMTNSMALSHISIYALPRPEGGLNPIPSSNVNIALVSNNLDSFLHFCDVI